MTLLAYTLQDSLCPGFDTRHRRYADDAFIQVLAFNDSGSDQSIFLAKNAVRETPHNVIIQHSLTG